MPKKANPFRLVEDPPNVKALKNALSDHQVMLARRDDINLFTSWKKLNEHQQERAAHQFIERNGLASVDKLVERIESGEQLVNRLGGLAEAKKFVARIEAIDAEIKSFAK